TLVANFIDEKVYPPVNVNIQRLENDLIFYKEYVNRLTWQPNELNKIMVLQYFIYVKPKGSSNDDYRLLARVFFDTFQYDHRNLKKDDLYTYRITSFNIQGKESSYVEISN
ncbi:MAG: fibronectin type III domain-containing protein, partial [Melioribacter sp.]|nr:fibronectin type III domain-containing protein [Melioribacter sp.]